MNKCLVVVVLVMFTVTGGCQCSSRKANEQSGPAADGTYVVVKKRGESTFTAARRADPVERSLVQRMTVERRGEVVVDYVVKMQATLVVVEGRYGPSVGGVRIVKFEGVPGGKFTGTVDGRAVLPFDTNAALRFEDGTTAPTPAIKDPDARREIDALLQSLAAPVSEEDIGHATQPIIKGGVPGDTGLSLECAACGIACVATVTAIGISGYAGCSAFLFCPPCAVICYAVVTAAVFLVWDKCFSACQRGICAEAEPPCGSVHCSKGERCLDMNRGACCPVSTVPCGNVECCESDKGEVCIVGHCCEPPNGLWGGVCCPKKSQQTLPSGAQVCCEGEVCGDGTCCTLGSCTGDVCCPGGRACGDACCESGDVCAGGTCCSPERACGGICCGTGQVCADPATKRCAAAPPDECIPVKEVSLPDGTGANICCKRGTSYACNGECCGRTARGVERCCAIEGVGLTCSDSCIH